MHMGEGYIGTVLTYSSEFRDALGCIPHKPRTRRSHLMIIPRTDLMPLRNQRRLESGMDLG